MLAIGKSSCDCGRLTFDGDLLAGVEVVGMEHLPRFPPVAAQIKDCDGIV